MKRMATTILAATLALTACGTPDKEGDSSNNGSDISKEQARDRAGKGDATDFCERFGWYDDGICDDFCAEPDPDCGDTNNGTNNGSNNNGSNNGTGGEEGDLCGGFGGFACNDGLVCAYPAGTCGLADGAGTCVVAPDACDASYAPVCGCDGQTYSNSCTALAAGMTVDYDGECEGPQPGDCDANADCAAGQFCNLPGLSCGGADGRGTCEPIPDVCPENYAPVCGCDGQTYSNECFANGAGTSIASQGECPVMGDVCGGFAGLACPAGEICKYPEGQCNVADGTGTCVPGGDVCPDVYDPVCGCDGKTYGNDCEATLAGASIDHSGACGMEKSCGGFAGQTCADYEYCYFEPNTFCDYADAQGVCKPRPDACTFEIDPVCGCDGTTYDNECMAAMAGVGLATDMACTN